MHYQLFGAMGCSLNDSDPKVPLMLWLNGGPGSSSLLGAFAENGPIRIVNGTPALFKHSWSVMAHLLFVDQPLNVGFSYDFGGRNPNSSRETATHLINFLYNFYREWPQLAASPLYIAGESFAGHYIPPFAHAILSNATFRAATGCSLRGVALGNAWVDPANQLNYYDSLLYSAGVVSNKFRDVCQWMQTQGLLNLYSGRFANVPLPPPRPLPTSTSSPTTPPSGRHTSAA
jgi:carboxypeptidase C (cathepsin A)